MHIFLIIFGTISILIVWGAGCFFYGRSNAEREDGIDMARVAGERDIARRRAAEFEALAEDYSTQYARLDGDFAVPRSLHDHCAAAAPLPDLDEPSTQLAFYQEFTGMYPVVGAAIDAGTDFTGGWDARSLREAIAAGDQLALPSGVTA